MRSCLHRLSPYCHLTQSKIVSSRSSQTELLPATGVTGSSSSQSATVSHRGSPPSQGAVTITVICSLLPNYSLDKALCALLNKEGQDGTENETVSDWNCEESRAKEPPLPVTVRSPLLFPFLHLQRQTFFQIVCIFQVVIWTKEFQNQDVKQQQLSLQSLANMRWLPFDCVQLRLNCLTASSV